MKLVYDSETVTIRDGGRPVAQLLVGDGGPDHQMGRLLAGAPTLFYELTRLIASSPEHDATCWLTAAEPQPCCCPLARIRLAAYEAITNAT